MTAPSVTERVADRSYEEELAGGYDPIRFYMEESPEHFLTYNIRLKGKESAAAEEAMITETALDVTAVVLAAQSLWSDIGSKLASTEMPSAGAWFQTSLSLALLGAAVYSFKSMMYERDFKREANITAQAIKRVADTDNGIDTKDLLPAFVMELDRHPEEMKTDWWRRIDYYRPSVEIGEIPPEFSELIEAEKEKIREENASNGAKRDILPNLARAFVTATKSLTTELPQTAREFWQSTKTSYHILRNKHRMSTIRNMQTWIEQKMANREAHAALIYDISVRKDGNADEAQEKADAILNKDLEASFTPKYLGIRRAQSAQIESLRENVTQQFQTVKGVAAANTFMVVNGTLAAIETHELFTTTPPEFIPMLTQGFTALLFAGLAHMNVPPARTLYSSLTKLSDRYEDNGDLVIQEHSRVAKELSSTVEIVTAFQTMPKEEIVPANEV